jgi:hypothetical protein
MKKIRWWIFLGAMWVAKKVCVYGFTLDHLNAALASEDFGDEDWWDDI